MKSITDKYLKSLFTAIGGELKQLVDNAESMPYTTKMAEGNKEGILDAKKVLDSYK